MKFSQLPTRFAHRRTLAMLLAAPCLLASCVTSEPQISLGFERSFSLSLGSNSDTDLSLAVASSSEKEGQEDEFDASLALSYLLSEGHVLSAMQLRPLEAGISGSGESTLVWSWAASGVLVLAAEATYHDDGDEEDLLVLGGFTYTL